MLILNIMAKKQEIPDEFIRVIKDFVGDIKTTFPEYIPFINKWWKEKEHFDYIEEENDKETAYAKSFQKNTTTLFAFCQKKLPPRFFDILYQNDEMFTEESDIDTEFLPNIHFKNLWQYDITDKTRETIWKYLQLLLFSIVGSLENKDAFGDTAKMFEAINTDDFKDKLQETLSQMEGLFDLSGNMNSEKEGVNLDDLPNAEEINDHINGMLGGSLGKFARELAQDAVENLGIDLNDTTDMKGVFNKLVKNPTKLMGLMQKISGKLDSKLKSGELKESEILQEASDVMSKMKNMPGMGNIQSMLSSMGMNMSGLGKMNTGAMESQLNQRMKMAKTKERIRAKAEATAKARAEKEKMQTENVNHEPKPAASDEELIQLFSSSEKMERTPRGSNPEKMKPTTNPKKKKGKGKK